MSLEAPNPTRFQPINNHQSKKQPDASDADTFQFEYKSATKPYNQQDITPKPPKKGLTWLEYHGGHSTDDALNQLESTSGKTLLKFSNINTQDTGLNKLLKSLHHKPQIQHFIIRHSNLSPQHIAHIEHLLIRNDGIAWLVLDHNKIDDRGIRHISKGLEENNGVINLVLNHNQIGNPGAKSLANMLQKNHHVKTLFLQNNNISDDGALALAHTFKSRPPLKTIDIRNNPISNTAIKTLALVCQEKNITLYHS